VAAGLAPVASAGLVNPGFEQGDASAGDFSGAPGWGNFNFAFTTRQAARGGAPGQSLKMFGSFSNDFVSGAVQSLAASPGEQWKASAYAFDAGAADPDGIKGNNFSLVILQFFNGGTNIGEIASPQFNASAPDQEWIEVSASGIAPAGTTAAQILLLHVNADRTGGAVFFDDASLAVVIPEPATGMALAGMMSLSLLRRR
jgi:hypothetical protein